MHIRQNRSIQYDMDFCIMHTDTDTDIEGLNSAGNAVLRVRKLKDILNLYGK